MIIIFFSVDRFTYIETNSYSSEVELTEGAYGIDEWTEELADPESEEFLNLSRAICAAVSKFITVRSNTLNHLDAHEEVIINAYLRDKSLYG